MLTGKDKPKYSGLVIAAAVALPTYAMAASTNINAVASFIDSLTLANEVDMDFGSIEFSAAPAAGDRAELGSNGSIVYAGNFDGTGTGTAGSVDVVTGTDGLVVEVFCDDTATMEEAGGESIDVVDVHVDREGTTGAHPGAGNGSCNGVAGAAADTMTLNIGAGTADQFYFGGIVDGNTASGGFAAGAYSTATGGGDDIQIDVFYQ